MSFLLSMSCEVKSLPGIPSSPAPALATFNQVPSQPQTSQTLTPLAVQPAPQVRATLGSWTETKAWDYQDRVAMGSGNFTRQDGEGAVAWGRESPARHPRPPPCRRSGPLGKVRLCLPGNLLGCSKDGRDYINSFISQAFLFL